ncbi:arginine deiminase [Georgenia sp. SYP-B2076]|uniref:arginine deiminase n=1 Tax=Georgenia sp. SYP-B2076 TaxID=2495881 RepID=UPI000F8EF8B0|nr:arginine deiminase [Georgenia sp. SYP-B2076]
MPSKNRAAPVIQKTRALGVGSEVGQLHQVILHRPGPELQRLTPQNMDHLLFDDLLWVRRAQEEHDQFSAVLADAGVEVLLLADLLRETLAVPEAKHHILDRTFDERSHGRGAAPALHAMAAAMDDADLATALIGGLTKREVLERIPEPRSVVMHGLGLDDLVLSPLPNHLFTRDTSSWVYDGVALSAMRRQARVRESVHYDAIYSWHPRFAGATFQRWSAAPALGAPAVEGGDVLVLGDGAVLVGMGERTTPQAVERLAARLFAGGTADRVVALTMPKARQFMHLDTVMTMVDAHSFIKYAGLGMLPSYTITPGAAPGELRMRAEEPDLMHAVIAEAMGVDVRFLTPEQDAHTAAREQWDDGCNALALAPGVVVTYDRNATANAYLRQMGVEVLAVPGGELGRGRGGPHCMSCPTIREGI